MNIYNIVLYFTFPALVYYQVKCYNIKKRISLLKYYKCGHVLKVKLLITWVV